MHLITSEELIAFHRCQRLPYLQRVGPWQERLDTDDLVKQLRLDRQHLREQVQASHPGVKVPTSKPDPLTDPQTPVPVQTTDPIAIQTTQEWMEQQQPHIYRAQILTGMPELDPEVQILVQPDLLIWKAYPPRPHLPPGFYQPVEIRTGKRVKPEYELLLALHALALGQIQPVTPSRGLVVLRDGQWYTISLTHRYPQVRRLIQDFLSMWAAQQMPKVYMARSRCSLCHWRQFCRQLAAESDPLTLLPGITGNRHLQLQSIGIHTIPDLAQASPADLRSLSGMNTKVALSLIQQARATQENRPFWSSTKAHRSPQPTSSPIEIYFDIEADPKHDVAYLLGVLVKDHTTAAEHYHPLLATDPQTEEEATWQAFLELVHRHPQAPIYHFHAFEIHTCRKLAERYRTPSAVLRSLLARFIDLHDWVTRHLILPVESYSLKNIARWMGFEWRIAEANGAQSIYWYAQWLETQDREFLETLISYNQDDCRATLHLKQWLQTHWSEIGESR